MKYKTGDIVKFKSYKHHDKNYNHLLISNNTTKDYIGDQIYYGYTIDKTSINITDSMIESYGVTEDIITDQTMMKLLSLEVGLDNFYKCVMIHMINKTSKYNLQFLYKINNEKQKSHHYTHSIQEVIDLINSKQAGAT